VSLEVVAAMEVLQTVGAVVRSCLDVGSMSSCGVMEEGQEVQEGGRAVWAAKRGRSVNRCWQGHSLPWMVLSDVS
jgi:hypothetical protein